MLNELYTFAEPVQVVPFSNLKWGKFTLLHTIQSGSFGGIVQYNIVRVPHYEISIGGTIASFEQIPSKVPATDGVMDSVDGNLGIDLIKKASTFILNFKDMFVMYVLE